MDKVSHFHQPHSAQITPDHIQNTSDDTLAVGFVDQHHEAFRYIGQWNKWRVWDGKVWKFDHKLQIYNRVRVFLRTTAKSIAEKIYRLNASRLTASTGEQAKDQMRDARNKSQRAVKGILSASTVHAVAGLARSDSRIASDIDQWDADPWLLNTPGGTVNLLTGAMHPHNPLNYITKVTAVAPAPGEPLIWLRFLNRIMGNDADMVSYLQKIFGYCLVGDPKEHEMYFGYGTGRNGKGTVANVMRDLMGDYGIEASIETFTTGDGNRHPTELADLQGARLVTCGEIDEGQRWAEARIKRLTGGDPVKARFMRQDFFEYRPQFKLFIFGNHKPHLSNVDPAIEARFRLIPFTQYIPAEERDTSLGDKLRAEWPQILQWGIDGCLAWQANGLRPPAAVAEATDRYLAREDATTCWLGECVALGDSDTFEYTAALFKSWETWARDNGSPVGTKRQLASILEDREPLLGIKKARRAEGFGFRGMELLTPPS